MPDPLSLGKSVTGQDCIILRQMHQNKYRMLWNNIVKIIFVATLVVAEGDEKYPSRHKVQSIDFFLHEQSGEWISEQDLPNLGIDLRDVKQPAHKPAANELFRTHHRVSPPKSKEDGKPRGLFEANVCAGGGGGGGGEPTGPPFYCDAIDVDQTNPCAQCQQRNTQHLLVRFSDYDTCFTFDQCVDIRTGDCSRGTDNCFQSYCPPPPTTTTDEFNTTDTTTDTSTLLDYLPFVADLCYRNGTEKTDCGGKTDYCYGTSCTSRRELAEWTKEIELLDIEEERNHKARKYTGFVRIPKTGSTTLLKFLDKQKYMLPWNDFVKGKRPRPHRMFRAPGRRMKLSRKKRHGPGGPSGGCIFGRPTSREELSTIKAGGSSSWWNTCPHLPFGKLVEAWARSLPHWMGAPPTVPSEHSEHSFSEKAALGAKSNVALEDTDEPYTMSLEVFTMLRDPFDRLTSYFFYLRKFSYTNNFLRNTVSEKQYEFVEENDLEGWLRQLHLENGGRALELPYQYKYVHEDIDEALQLIQNDSNSPQIYALLTECYEVSLRLLTQTLGYFDPQMIDAFVQSDDFSTNNNQAFYKEKPRHDELAAIRAKAEVWFADDFRFYDEAVEQFVGKMATSGLDASVLETCVYWNQQ